MNKSQEPIQGALGQTGALEPLLRIKPDRRQNTIGGNRRAGDDQRSTREPVERASLGRDNSQNL